MDQTLSRTPGAGKPCADSAAPRMLKRAADPPLSGRVPFPSAPPPRPALNRTNHVHHRSLRRLLPSRLRSPCHLPLPPYTETGPTPITPPWQAESKRRERRHTRFTSTRGCSLGGTQRASWEHCEGILGNPEDCDNSWPQEFVVAIFFSAAVCLLPGSSFVVVRLRVIMV